MKWFWLILLTLLLLPAGCRRDDAANQISSRRAAATFPPPGGEALVLSVVDLAAAPEAYAGRFVRVTGEYRRRPLLICDAVPRRAPVTWYLGEEGVMIGGCGKEATAQDVWYLAVSEIIAPNPVARVTLTPAAGGLSSPTAETLVEVGTETPARLATATPAGPQPVGTPLTVVTETPFQAPGSATMGAPVATATRQATTATATVAGTSGTPGTPQVTATSGVEPAASATAAVATATATTPPTATGAAAGTATATASLAEPTSTATATMAAATATAIAPEDLTVVDREAAEYQNLIGDTLERDQGHRREFAVDAGDVLTISVIAPRDRDLVLEVQDPTGETLLRQNDSPAGQVERIEGLVADMDGDYGLLVYEVSGAASDYVMMLLNSNAGGYNFIFVGFLRYGESVTVDMLPDSDNFWFFVGSAGDVISFTITPNKSADLFFDMYNPAGEKVVNFTDKGVNGEAESLANYRLGDSGIYSIRVGEYDFEAANYTISLSGG
jgi:hypothetical protein